VWRERSGKEIEGQEPLPSNFNTPSKSEGWGEMTQNKCELR
jgi:hypothetical protein